MVKNDCLKDVRNKPSFEQCEYSGVSLDGYNTFLKKVITTGGNILLEKQLALTFHEDFANEEKLLKEKFSGVAEQQAFDRDLALFYEKIS